MIIPFLSMLPSISDSESLDPKQLAQVSTAVIVGEVLTQRVQADSGGISTYVTIMVNDTLKGNKSDVIDVRVPGGSFGNLKAIVPGTPKFINDTEVLLFLNGTTIVGIDDGAMIIEGGRAWRAVNNKEFTLPHLLFPSLDILESSYYFDSWDLEDIRYIVSGQN
jgi:hypothetical protein